MARMPIEVMEVFNDPEATKMLATVSKDVKVNVVPIASMSAMDDQTLMFMNMFVNKTKQNLQVNKNVAATVFKSPATAYQVKGEFTGFVTEGPFFDMCAEMVFQQLPLHIHGVGLISVKEVYSLGAPKPGEKVA